MGYVANCVEHLRDGQEMVARLFHTKRQALDWMSKIRNGFGGDCHTFQLFELGKEIKLTMNEETEPQPVKIVKKFVTEEEENQPPPGRSERRAKPGGRRTS